MSLAERAAAARRAHAGSHREAAAPALTPEQRGSVHGNKYINDFFHFEVSQPAQWELYSAGRMNVSEAIGNEY